MARPKESERVDLEKEVIGAAWRQIARDGAAALSLRGIARALEITAPAIYNYYPNRDALVTALIVDAFGSFGDALAEGIAQLAVEDHPARFKTLGLAYRRWAIAYPERYQLIFGTPIAGYTAPQEVTSPVAGRALEVLVTVLAKAADAGALNAPPSIPQTELLPQMLAAWQAERATELNAEILYLALSVWSRVHGLVSLELGNLYPSFITEPGEIFDAELQHMVEALFPTEARPA